MIGYGVRVGLEGTPEVGDMAVQVVDRLYAVALESVSYTHLTLPTSDLV